MRRVDSIEFKISIRGTGSLFKLATRADLTQ